MKEIKNPYLPLNTYIPDGEPHVFGDTLYVYGSCDIPGSNQFCLGEYKVAYAKVDDLTNFTVVPSYSFADSGQTYDEGGSLQAPDCVKGFDGRYYLYYNRMKKNECEVAVSDSPKGPFKFLANVHLEDGTVPNSKLFDPGVFVEGDKVYLYVGFCPTKESRWASIANKYSQVYILKKDMVTIAEGPYDLIPGPIAAPGTEFEGHGFYEASSMRKFDGVYYLIYSSEVSHDLCYAYSNYPDKEFKFGGVLISNGNIGFNGNTEAMYPFGNTHGSIEKIGDKYYVFYHRQTHDRECSRQAMAEVIEMKDHRFIQAEMTTQGLNGKPLNDINKLSSAYACVLKKLGHKYTKMSIYESQKDLIPYIVEDKDKHFITNIKGEVVVGFKYFKFNTANHIRLNVSGSDGRIEVYQNLDGNKVGEATIMPNQTTYEIACDFTKGKFPLYIKFISKENINFFDLELLNI